MLKIPKFSFAIAVLLLGSTGIIASTTAAPVHAHQQATPSATNSELSNTVHSAAAPPDNTFSLYQNADGRIGLSVRSINGISPVVGTYRLYDAATVSGSAIASVTVSGYGDYAIAATTRSIVNTMRFAVAFTSTNSNYTDQTWTNVRVLCNAGTYNSTDGYLPCTPADIGYYVPIPGSTSQTVCPDRTESTTTGSASCILLQTRRPTLNLPLSNSVFNLGGTNPIFRYTLPEVPAQDRVNLIWVNSDDSTTRRTVTLDTSTGIVDLGAFDPLAVDNTIVQVPHVARVSTTIGNVSSTTLRMPSGSYNFTIVYQNLLLGPANSDTVVSVVLRERCTAGKYSNDGFTPCTPASTGHFASSDNTQDVPCAPGSYQPETGAASCLLARLGYFVENRGATAESVCPSGTTTTSTGSLSCSLIVVPTTTPTSSASSITNCTVRKGKTISKSCLSRNAGITVPSSSKISIVIAASSKNICKLSGASVRALKSGTCSTTLKVTPKKGKTKSYKAKVVITP